MSLESFELYVPRSEPSQWSEAIDDKPGRNQLTVFQSPKPRSKETRERRPSRQAGWSQLQKKY